VKCTCNLAPGEIGAAFPIAEFQSFGLLAMPIIWVFAPMSVASFSSFLMVAINPSVAQQWLILAPSRAGPLSRTASGLGILLR
jgi:hypothetical protein